MIRLLTLHVCLLANLLAYGQFHYNFDTVNTLSQTKWLGDVSHFVPEDGILRLQAPEAGSSRLFHLTNIPDSSEMHLSFKMDFSPSANNKLRVFLQLDTTDLNLASGYYFEIGENGSEDKISFVRILNGESLTLAEGMPGKFSEGPVEASIKINKNSQGLWQVFIRQNDETFYQTELELFDSTVKRHFDQYFGLECLYTSTRTDKFFFDNIYVQEAIEDTLGPSLLKVNVLSGTELELEFDDLLDNSTVLNTGNYRLNPSGQFPSTIIFNEFKPHLVRLILDMPIESNTLYTLEIQNLTDINGNGSGTFLSNQFYLAETPASGDLLINEILFDPYEDGSDFVELYNRSGKILSLSGLSIANRTKSGSYSRIEQDMDLFPGEYIAVSPDTLSIHQYYEIPIFARLLQNALPAFNNDEGNVSLYGIETEGGCLIDSFDYKDSMHFPLIRDTEGISLERIHVEVPATDLSNWQSAGTLTGGATPGYKNTQSRSFSNETNDYFRIPDPVFSPDGDGFSDQLAIYYQFPKDGFAGSIYIFDSFGNFILKLINNQLLGAEGAVIWNGLNLADGQNLTGPYILFCEAFHPDGTVIRKKLVSYLVEKI